jgi:hypothetical protein
MNMTKARREAKMQFPKAYEKAYQELVAYLDGAYEAVGTYKKLAEFLDNGVSPSYLHQILHYGYRPTGGKNAEKLGLPKIKLVPRLVLDRPKRVRTKRVRIDLDPGYDQKTIDLIRATPMGKRMNALNVAALLHRDHNYTQEKYSTCNDPDCPCSGPNKEAYAPFIDFSKHQGVKDEITSED